jgi:GTP:adenosylcobinamide-phosphate guanylyltransferase
MADSLSAQPRVDSIVLAGGTIADPEFRQAVGVDRRPLIDLLGKPMAQWVVEALRASRSTGRVVVLSRPDLRQTPVAGLADEVVEEGVDEVDSLFRGIEALPGAQQVLMVSSDLALLTPDAVDDFVANAPADADVVIGILEKADIPPDLQHHEWIFSKWPDGQFTGASCFLFKPEAIAGRRQWVQEVFDARRSVWRLMRMWGLGFLLRLLLHRVALAEAEAHVGKVLGVRGRAYITRHIELCFDVDKLSDVTVAEEQLRRRQAG